VGHPFLTGVENTATCKGIIKYFNLFYFLSNFFSAAYFGHLEIVTDLLAAGADINQSDSHNKTALYVATYHGRTDIVRTLIRNNAHVNRTDKNGKSPLYIAVLHGNLQIAELLIKGMY
jgi:ankyrin repeat protein